MDLLDLPCGVLLLDLSEILNLGNLARRSIVHHLGELVADFVNFFALPPMLGYVYLAE